MRLRAVTCAAFWAAAVVLSCLPAMAAAPEPPAEILADWHVQDKVDPGASCKDAAGRVADALGDAGKDLRRHLAREQARRTPAQDPVFRKLYLHACLLRREARLRALSETFREFVFTKHYDMGGSHYAYTEGQSDAQNERHFTPGSALCLYRFDGPFGHVETLLDDPNGVIRDPDVSADGERVLFAWKKALDGDDYHLYEMRLADRSVRQITSGAGFADYEGVYLPDGGILFNSTRCVQTVDCWWTEVSNLYTCDQDGRFLRRVSHDQVHTNYPTVTWDGRVLYTRWDYSDRGQIYPQGLFQMHPDGTYQTEFYGNNSWFPTSILHARSIPGSMKVLAVFSGHHSPQKGWLGVLDPAQGRQENAGAQLIAPVRRTQAVHVDAYGQDGGQFQYPFPLDENEFLVTFKPARSESPFRVYWMDRDGRRELLAWDASVSCNQPVPVHGRPLPFLRPSLVDHWQDSGTFYLQDIYQGPGLQGIPRGTVKKLRVVALEFRAAGVGHNTNHGPAGGALASTPVSIEGTWDVKRVLGTARVHDDGSAFFRAPAGVPVYFQALDADNQAVQTMRSWAQLRPGESFACVGCHESKNSAPPPLPVGAALRLGPQELDSDVVPARGFSFEREVQPILDRHCVQCHYQHEPERMVNPGVKPKYQTTEAAEESVPEPPEGAGKGASVKPAFSLAGAPGKWSPAYRSLANRRVTDWINIQESPELLPPRRAGAVTSPLMRMLREGHHGVRLAPEELAVIACWIDLLVPAFGDYTEGLSGEGLAFYTKFLDKREAWRRQEAENIREMLR